MGLLEDAGNDMGTYNVLLGNVNQSIVNFFKLVVDPLADSIQRNFTKRFLSAHIFMQAVKVVVIKLCNSVLALLQLDGESREKGADLC